MKELCIQSLSRSESELKIPNLFCPDMIYLDCLSMFCVYCHLVNCVLLSKHYWHSAKHKLQGMNSSNAAAEQQNTQKARMLHGQIMWT